MKFIIILFLNIYNPNSFILIPHHTIHLMFYNPLHTKSTFVFRKRPYPPAYYPEITYLALAHIYEVEFYIRDDVDPDKSSVSQRARVCPQYNPTPSSLSLFSLSPSLVSFISSFPRDALSLSTSGKRGPAGRTRARGGNFKAAEKMSPGLLDLLSFRGRPSSSVIYSVDSPAGRAALMSSRAEMNVSSSSRFFPLEMPLFPNFRKSDFVCMYEALRIVCLRNITLKIYGVRVYLNITCG